MKFPKGVILEGDYIILKPDVSEETFWQISNEDSNYELINGVLVIHSPASEEHESIFKYLNTILNFYLEETQEGKVYGSRYVVRLSKKWNPEPDLMIILPENYQNIKKTRFEGPADIVIEILSKSARDIDLNQKIPKYLEMGVKEIWVFDPENTTIVLVTPEDRKTWSDPHTEEIIQSGVLPNLQFQVQWIWNREKFPTNLIIKTMIKSLSKG